MNLHEIAFRSHQFHRMVYISLTQKCPLRCRHCFVESGPDREEHADIEAYRRWIDGIIAKPDVEILLFSGGEPFNHSHALRYGLERCNAAARYSIVCSSAFWARTADSAARFLDKYPTFSCLWISTDTFHEEFVPLSYVRNAVEVANRRGIFPVIQVVDEGEASNAFLVRLRDEVGADLIKDDQVYLVPLDSVGRARTELVALPNESRSTKPTWSNVRSSPCPWLGTPWLHEDGVLCACPNLEVYKSAQHPLKLGNLSETDFSSISSQAEHDDFIQALRVYGPRALVDSMPLQQWGWDPDSLRGEGICDLCHSLAQAPDLPHRVRQYLSDPKLSSEIRILRLGLYSDAPSATGNTQ